MIKLIGMVSLEAKTKQKLEYHWVLEKLASFCASEPAKERALCLEPSADLKEVQKRQGETSEAKEFLSSACLPSLASLKELRPALRRAQKGGVLTTQELLAFKNLLVTARSLKRLFATLKSPFPLLKAIVERIVVLEVLEKELSRAIGEKEEVLDSASPELAHLRRQAQLSREKIKEELERMLRTPEFQRYLQDSFVTIRNSRYVVPVKQEYRAFFPGLIHDQSASGATLFIEPLAVVELNNQLQQIAWREKQVINSILERLSRLIKAEAEALASNFDALVAFDLALAKAHLSRALGACEPKLNEEGKIFLQKGRHPLLGQKAVPLSLTLGEDFDVLVITGPNAGGKTVALKTVGLLTLMAQAGLHVPAAEGTELAVFKAVFTDIGDEQSLEQSLSTFSAHFTQIGKILAQADASTLVLLDELGAGTDPAEGTALAKAALECLRERRAKVIATTHAGGLKVYAAETPRVENACLEFDPETLLPTYQLTLGLPGQSNALEIARQLGISSEIIRRAESFLTGPEREITSLVRDLKARQQTLKKEQERLEAARRESENLAAEMRERERKLAAKERELLQDAYQKAEEFVQEALTESKKILAAVRQAAADSAPEKKKVLQNQHERLSMLAREIRKKARFPSPGQPPAKVSLGEYVVIPYLNLSGYVTGISPQGEVQMQTGLLKINVPLTKLRKADPPSLENPFLQAGKGFSSEKTLCIHPQLDLRGLTVSEAVAKTEKYLDDAHLAGLNRITLIHGKGTGALRRALQEYLAKHPQVKDYHLAAGNEGGAGATVVELAL